MLGTFGEEWAALMGEVAHRRWSERDRTCKVGGHLGVIQSPTIEHMLLHRHISSMLSRTEKRRSCFTHFKSRESPALVIMAYFTTFPHKSFHPTLTGGVERKCRKIFYFILLYFLLAKEEIASSRGELERRISRKVLSSLIHPHYKWPNDA